MKNAKNIIEAQKTRIVKLTKTVDGLLNDNEKLSKGVKEADKAVKEAYITLKKDTDTRKAVESLGNLEFKGLIKTNKLFILKKWKSIMGNL